MKQLSLFPTSSGEKATKIWDEVVRLRAERNINYQECPLHRKKMIKCFTEQFDNGHGVVIYKGDWILKSWLNEEDTA